MYLKSDGLSVHFDLDFVDLDAGYLMDMTEWL